MGVYEMYIYPTPSQLHYLKYSFPQLNVLQMQKLMIEDDGSCNPAHLESIIQWKTEKRGFGKMSKSSILITKLKDDSFDNKNCV